MDERDNYGYGYAPAPERFHALKSGRRQERINMIAGYRDRALIAPITVEGSCNRSVFEVWLETCLIPQLQPGEWVIVDNATFHHGGQIAQLIESAACQLVYLPPYLPDFNRTLEVLGMVEKPGWQTVTQSHESTRGNKISA
ncbi:MAG: transposase [Rubrobacter sp.]|nr:transposase [Rubrobacter sp.]